jgi:uncharacterized membrane protein (DUF485 family)
MRSILFILAIILIIGWVVGFFALKIASGLIHILLVVALIAIVVSFIKGRTSAN